MTTLDFDAIASRLEAVGLKFRAARVAHALATWLLIILPPAVLVVFAAGLLALPGLLVVALLAAVAALAVVAYAKTIHAPLWQRPSYAQIARWIEENAAAKNLPLSNDLINAVLLSQEPARPHSLVPVVIREIAARTAGVNLESAVPWARYFKRIAAAAITVLLLAITIGLFPGPIGHGLKVLANPLGFVPKTGSARIDTVAPGDDTVLLGQSINFAVGIDIPANQLKVLDASLTMNLKSGKSLTVPMTVFGNDNRQYRYTLASATEDMDYVISVGSGSDVTQSKRFHITVVPEIHLTAYRIQITPPAYTGRDAQTVTIPANELTAARGTIEAPQGSAIMLTVGLDGPARNVLIDAQGAQPIMLAAGEGNTFNASLTLRDSVRYALRINDGEGRTLKRYPEDNGSSSSFAFVAIADQPPTVPQVTEPGRDMDAKPGQTIQFAAAETDDIGLTEVRLEVAHTKANAPKGAADNWTTAKSWTFDKAADGKPVRGISVRHAMTLDPAQFALGDMLRYRFVGVDNRTLPGLGENGADLGRQTTVGEVFTINISDTAAAAAKSTQLWDQLRKQLQAILEKQVALRNTVRDAKPKDVTEAKTIAKRTGDGQISVRSDIDKLAKTFPFEPKMKLIQKTLEVLTLEDATTAIDRSNDLALVSDLKAAPALAGKLLDSQNRIIDTLQTLLAIASAEEDKSKQIASSTGGDIPSDPNEAWKKLEDKLKEFEKQQKQVIDATADLAKKPKDQWDKNDQANAKAAAAIEDKWEKFLNERLLDMSKIAEQDQANASILEEMVQMKVELAMAKAALDTKATEIATPLEENGLEEAKALDTHIERWLQQQPDRTKWQMEDAVAQAEAPMAELPKQLQDMMGDLMDQQEDLTQDMESTAGKFADSLNKGAGWDAADGPISNMSAQGVTGNQMPKDMEIQGRSGDGREGRSSGEMVGATAEDKGGRQTPTRMTNEPFSNGQIDDKAQQPAGGATGGGKRGGMGGEGLEGASPDKNPNDPIQRMAQKQADLHNQAERLGLQMHANGYSQEKLFEAVTLMQKAEESIKANRYENAVNYQQQAADSLNTAKLMASGQMHVTLDSTPQASTKVQKDMQDAMNGAMPKGYADPVKAYFERLSQPGN